MKLALGSVQFGRPYGISNAAGQVAEDEVARILRFAAAKGVDMLDTAPGYGEAESVLGRVLAAQPGRFRIVTKTPVLKDMAAGRAPAAAIGETFEGSLARLGVSRLHGLMAHLADDLLGTDGDAVWGALEHVRAQGLVSRIGTACYTPDELKTLLARYPLEIVQLPLNLFDQRAAASGLLARLAAAGVEVHVRSALLQGLLVMDPQALPEGFSRARKPLERLREAARAVDLGPLQLAIRFATSSPAVDCAVVGVTRRQELAEIVDALSAPLPAECGVAGLAVDDLAVITPSMWPPDSDQAWHFVYETKG